jgi:hypothetical protein
MQEYLSVELQLAGLVAVLSTMYIVGGLVTADVLRSLTPHVHISKLNIPSHRLNLKDYKCDYI